MKKSVLALAIAMAVGGVGTASAMSVDDRLMAMEKRLKYLEQRVQDQDDVIKEKDSQINSISKSSAWASNTSVGGLIEFEANNASPNAGQDTSDMQATVEVAIASQVNDVISAEAVLKWEESSGNDNVLVDTATVTYQDVDSPVSVTAGKFTMPFGVFESAALSDPITKELSEIGETALQIGAEKDGLAGAAYIFNGDVDENGKDQIASFGANVAYGTDAFSVGAGYLSNIADTDGISGVATAPNTHVSGYNLNAKATFGVVTVIAEHVSADKAFTNGTLNNQKPSATQIEIDFDAGPGTVALGHSNSSGANGAVAKKRSLAAYTFDIAENTNLGFEYAVEEDYAGAETDTVTAKLAVEF